MGGKRGGTGPAGKKNYYMYVYICMYCEFSFLLLLLLWHVINNLVLPNNTKCALPLVGRGRGGAERVRRGVRAKARYEAKTAL